MQRECQAEQGSLWGEQTPRQAMKRGAASRCFVQTYVQTYVRTTEIEDGEGPGVACLPEKGNASWLEVFQKQPWNETADSRFLSRFTKQLMPRISKDSHVF